MFATRRQLWGQVTAASFQLRFMAINKPNGKLNDFFFWPRGSGLTRKMVAKTMSAADESQPSRDRT